MGKWINRLIDEWIINRKSDIRIRKQEDIFSNSRIAQAITCV